MDAHWCAWNNAASLWTGAGAVERTGLQKRYTGGAPIDETKDTAKTYDDSGRSGHGALAPDLRTDPEIAAIVEA